MNKIKNILKNEFVHGQTAFDWAFLVVGLVLQVIGIIAGYMSGNPDSIGVIISGLAGVVSVVLCSQGKISFYAFGYLQLLTYVFCFSIPNHLHGETVENGMYALTMLYGMYAWRKNYGKDKETGATEIKAKALTKRQNALVAVLFVVGTLLYWQFLKHVPMFGVLDSDPFVDSITSIPAYIGQVLMVTGYREQWVYWFILDVWSIVLSVRAGSMVMAAQFIFWTLNCIYGYVKWSKLAKGDRTDGAA